MSEKSACKNLKGRGNQIQKNRGGKGLAKELEGRVESDCKRNRGEGETFCKNNGGGGGRDYKRIRGEGEITCKKVEE